MNREQKLQFIREKVAEANPEIMELKFGCEIQRKGRKHMYLSFSVKDEYGQPIWLLSPEGECWKERKSILDTAYELDGYEILGRPIRLADILLAIREEFGVESKFAVNAWGLFYEFSGEWKDGDTAKVKYLNLGWDLLHDSLSEQSEETIDFLCSLFPDYEKLR